MQSALCGVGLGLRWSFLSELLEQKTPPELAFVEISPENYMRRGGFFPSALQSVAERYRVVTHGLMMSLGSPEPLEPSYLQTLRLFTEELNVPWHSDHLSYSGLQGAFLHELLPVPFTAPMARHLADRIRNAQDALGCPMAVENISYYVAFDDSAMSEADFVCEVLERADCGLVLDINNIDVNAKNHGFDPLAFVRQMPLDRVVEVHVAGPEHCSVGLWLDTHGSPVRPEVRELLTAFLQQKGPVPVLLERDNNIPPLGELLQEVDELRQLYQKAVSDWHAKHSPGDSVVAA